MNSSLLELFMADALAPFSFRRDKSGPGLMGILNITPDSFHGPSRQHSIEEGLQQELLAVRIDIHLCRLQFGRAHQPEGKGKDNGPKHHAAGCLSADQFCQKAVGGSHLVLSVFPTRPCSRTDPMSL